MLKQKPITAKEKTIIVELYKNHTANYISKYLKTNPRRVKRALEEIGIKRPNKQEKFTLEIQKQIAEDYANGLFIQDIQKKYECGHTVIKSYAKKFNIPIRKFGQGKTSRFNQQDKLNILDSWQKGESQTSIGLRYNVSQVMIGLILDEFNIPKPDRVAKRTRSPYWKGGKAITKSGYIFIKIEKGHRFYHLANHRDYIFEHRLVMMEYLDRELLDSEQVHHINGNKSDNKIDNLELRQGAHGSGIKHQCQNCKSLNIIPVPLSTPNFVEDYVI